MKKSLLTLILLSGCSSQGIDRAEQNHISKEFYANVESYEQVKLSSNVKTGIVSGSVVGVIDEVDGNHEDMIAGGLAGALVGGLFTAVLEGSDTAYKYSLRSDEEGQFTLIQKELIDMTTGCVSVRVVDKVTISPAPEGSCDNLQQVNRDI
ncbi:MULTISPECIES: hypothetical protein [Vibrio]|uniref:hypothetical protein n=1 Tax=Vibrio TaxID=662 RepID=UPI000E535CDF|nr:hypothetical protein [Vibrio sp. dhg]AXT70661.1 hypothetical protein DBX26_06275 [Vibrio sp. dhg]